MASNINRRSGTGRGTARPQAPRGAIAAFEQSDDDPFSDIPSSPSPRRSSSRRGSSSGVPHQSPNRASTPSRAGTSGTVTHRQQGGKTHRPSGSRSGRAGGNESRLPEDLRNMDMNGSVASFRATDMPSRPSRRHNIGMRVQRGQLANMDDDESDDEYTGVRGWFGHDPEHTMLMLSGGSYKGNSLWDWVRLLILWMNYHKLVIVLISALFVLIGFMFNKYITVGWAFVTVILGVILTQMGDEYNEMVFYFAGIISFIIPFLW